MFSKKILMIGLCAFLIAGVALWSSYGYRRLMTEMASLKAEVASVKAESELRRDFIPPLFGARHVALRKQFILDQISQQSGTYGLILGDSIVEGMSLFGVGSLNLINGGMGGGRIIDAYDLLSTGKFSERPDFIIISIGVNDTAIATNLSSIDVLEATIEKLLARAKTLTRKVFLCTIFPVEKGKPHGDQYFDQTKIDSLNSVIKKLAQKHGVKLIELDDAFERLNEVYTTDGVHPNKTGYELIRGKINTALKRTHHL